MAVARRCVNLREQQVGAEEHTLVLRCCVPPAVHLIFKFSDYSGREWLHLTMKTWLAAVSWNTKHSLSHRNAKQSKTYV